MLSKPAIRREIRAARDALGTHERSRSSQVIVDRLLTLPAIRDAKSWFVYVSTGSEVQTHDLIRTLLARGNIVTVPLVTGPDQMVPCRIQSLDELHLGEFGILAPPRGDPYADFIEVCVCPAVAFTERGERLGWGRGFFDRYLAARPPELAIGLAYECQIVSQLPQEIHDRRMDFLATEKRLMRCR
jgi:5-formyltetrahydrofolate cyclo-ligase